MEIKNDIIEEIKKYNDIFLKYDNEIAKRIEKRENEYNEKRKLFEEKWDDDIFPTDIPIRDKESEELENDKKNLDNLKQKYKEEVKLYEKKLVDSVIKWADDISKRREEIVEYVKDKEKYLEEKAKLEKELKQQKNGIEVWEKNGINKNDGIYRRRKDVIVPNLENQINELNLKLDETKIRSEYKELGILANKINSIRMHDRNHMIPELMEIFEIGKDSKEPVKTQEPKQVEEPIKVIDFEQENELESKKEKTKPIELEVPDFLKDDFLDIEDLDLDGVEINGIEMDSKETSPNPKDVKTTVKNPNDHSTIVIPKPIQTTIPKQSTTEAEPIKQEARPVSKIDIQPIANIKIGRKIKIRYTDGEKGKITDIKNYFKYIRKNENASEKLKNELKDLLGVDKSDEQFPVDNVEPIIIYGLIEAIKKDFLVEDNVMDIIEAIGNKDKKMLDNILPIKWDKTDLSKGAFLPWNRKNRDKIAEIADRNSDIMDIEGEYQPNPFKRIFKSAKKLLPQRQKQELLTEGSEKIEQPVSKKEKLSERDGIKISKAYIEFSDLINEITDPERSKKWYAAYNQAIERGKLTEKEANDLKELYSKQLSKLVKDRVISQKTQAVVQNDKEK